MVTILAVFVEPPSSYSEHCVPRRAENFHYYYLTVQDFCPPLPLAADYVVDFFFFFFEFNTRCLLDGTIGNVINAYYTALIFLNVILGFIFLLIFSLYSKYLFFSIDFKRLEPSHILLASKIKINFKWLLLLGFVFQKVLFLLAFKKQVSSR